MSSEDDHIAPFLIELHWRSIELLINTLDYLDSPQWHAFFSTVMLCIRTVSIFRGFHFALALDDRRENSKFVRRGEGIRDRLDKSSTKKIENL